MKHSSAVPPDHLPPRRRWRALCWSGTALLVLTGCGGVTPSPGDTSSPSETTNAPAPASAADGSTPAASPQTTEKKTEIIPVNPWDADGTLAEGTEATGQGEPGACRPSAPEEGSPYGIGDNTFDCGGGAMVSEACASSPRNINDLACLYRPWNRQVITQTANGLKPNHREGSTKPFAFETAQGAKYVVRMGGAVDTPPDGMFAAYWCVEGCPADTNFAAFSWDTEDQAQPVVEQSQPLWRVKVQDYQDKTYHPDVQEVLRAWYVTGDSNAAAASSPSATTRTGVPAQAYQGAGGPVPASARTVSGSITTPSQNIGCDLASTVPGCGVLSLAQDGAMGRDSAGLSKWWVALVDTGYQSGVPRVMPKGDPPEFASGAAEEVGYGSVVHQGDLVCASEESGLTCWNASTGHGAVFSRDQIIPF